MTTGNRAVQWNAQKLVYDGVILLMAALGASTFVAVSRAVSPQFTAEQLVLRCAAFLSLLLLQVFLCAGPLSRLSPRFLPLLYNRRHLGVALFAIGAVHVATVMLFQFGGFSVAAVAHVFVGYAHEYRATLSNPAMLRHIPFEPFGAAAFVLLGLLAATSHDFWTRHLGVRGWRHIHLLAYPAYALVLLHAAFGLLQTELHWAYPILVGAGAVLVFGLHLAAAVWAPPIQGIPAGAPSEDGYRPVCYVSDLIEGEGRMTQLDGRPIAVFRHGGRAYALAGACPHEGGPLGEGRIVDEAVTCPWHGRQFQLEDGRSCGGDCPDLPTYPIRVAADRVYVHPEPHPPGAAARGTLLSGGAARVAPDTLREAEARFFIGQRGFRAASEQRFMGFVAAALVALAPLYMAIAAAAQSPPDSGAYERGSVYTYTGIYTASPLPSVYVSPDGGGPSGYPMVLTGPGATGVPAAWADADGMRVRFDATPLYRSEVVLLQLPDNAAPELLGPPPADEMPPPARVLQATTLTGELVDAHCYLGARRPGTGKLHRACAIRCLRQGSPAAIRIRTEVRESIVLIATPDMGSLEYIVPYAGREVVVQGSVFRTPGYLYIEAESVGLSRD